MVKEKGQKGMPSTSWRRELENQNRQAHSFNSRFSATLRLYLMRALSSAKGVFKKKKKERKKKREISEEKLNL